MCICCVAHSNWRTVQAVIGQPTPPPARSGQSSTYRISRSLLLMALACSMATSSAVDVLLTTGNGLYLRVATSFIPESATIFLSRWFLHTLPFYGCFYLQLLAVSVFCPWSKHPLHMGQDLTWQQEQNAEAYQLAKEEVGKRMAERVDRQQESMELLRTLLSPTVRG